MDTWFTPVDGLEAEVTITSTSSDRETVRMVIREGIPKLFMRRVYLER